MGKKKTPPPVIRDDPRVVEMAQCMVFAMQGFRNKPVFDPKTNQMETWHGWFKRVLEGAGYTVAMEAPKAK